MIGIIWFSYNRSVFILGIRKSMPAIWSSCFFLLPLPLCTVYGVIYLKMWLGPNKSLGMDGFLTDYPWRERWGELEEAATLTAERNDRWWGGRSQNIQKLVCCVAAQCKNGTSDDSGHQKRSDYVVILKRAVKSHFLLVTSPIKYIKKEFCWESLVVAECLIQNVCIYMCVYLNLECCVTPELFLLILLANS